MSDTYSVKYPVPGRQTNLVMVYWGGRGSGKTLSMTAHAILDDIKRGKNIFCNYPIEFTYISNNKEVHKKYPRIEIEDLISFRDDIRDGVIVLDELNLWASSRRSGAVLNQLLNAWIQLIRKRNLSVYVTAQDYGSLDKFIRWQCDISVYCHDMCYHDSRLQPGVCIAQRYVDRSGIIMGQPLWDGPGWREQEEENSWFLYFHGKPFWGTYDSWGEVDILEAMCKYQVQRQVKLIGQDGTITDKDIDTTFNSNEGAEVVRDMVKYNYPTGVNVRNGQAMRLLSGLGVQCDSEAKARLLLRRAGAEEVENGLRFA